MFCFVFGGILAKMDKNAELLIKIIEIINEASVKMIQLVMMYLNISIIINLDLIF
jgi:Na+/H+-dicarboxylate symporter